MDMKAPEKTTVVDGYLLPLPKYSKGVKLIRMILEFVKYTINCATILIRSYDKAEAAS